MRVGFVVAVLLTVGLFATSLVYAQAPDEAAKARQERARALLLETIGQIHELRLPENRAHMYTQAGNLLWGDDRSQAESLFAAAGDELVALLDPGVHHGPNFDNKVINYRQQILNSIGNMDAAFALTLLERTRPPVIADAMAARDAKDGRIRDTQNNSLNLLRNEAYLESSLIRSAAMQSPERAVSILKAGLARPFSNLTFDQLWQLAEKDPAAATEASSFVLARLQQSPFMRNGQMDYTVVSLSTQLLDTSLNETDNETKLKLDPSAIRVLAGKVVNAYLSDKNIRGYMSGDNVIRYAQKYIPAAVEEIKAVNPRATPSQPDPREKAYSDLMQKAPDQMLSGASKFTEYQRQQLYNSAANKYVEQGNVASARSIIEQNYDGEARRRALEEFDRNYFNRLLNGGKFQEAEAVASSMPIEERVTMLTSLALRVMQIDQKSGHERALSYLATARGLTGEQPQTQAEMSRTMFVVGAYAQLDPSTALDILEPMTSKMNDVMDASAVVLGFEGNSGVRDGEFVVMDGALGRFSIDAGAIARCAEADLERTAKFADSFSHPEVRVSLRLQMLQNGLASIAMRQIVPLPINRRTLLQRRY